METYGVPYVRNVKRKWGSLSNPEAVSECGKDISASEDDLQCNRLKVEKFTICPVFLPLFILAGDNH